MRTGWDIICYDCANDCENTENKIKKINYCIRYGEEIDEDEDDEDQRRLAEEYEGKKNGGIE